jgi:hypothetical protein
VGRMADASGVMASPPPPPADPDGASPPAGSPPPAASPRAPIDLEEATTHIARKPTTPPAGAPRASAASPATHATPPSVGSSRAVSDPDEAATLIASKPTPSGGAPRPTTSQAPRASTSAASPLVGSRTSADLDEAATQISARSITPPGGAPRSSSASALDEAATQLASKPTPSDGVPRPSAASPAPRASTSEVRRRGGAPFDEVATKPSGITASLAAASLEAPTDIDERRESSPVGLELDVTGSARGIDDAITRSSRGAPAAATPRTSGLAIEGASRAGTPASGAPATGASTGESRIIMPRSAKKAQSDGSRTTRERHGVEPPNIDAAATDPSVPVMEPVTDSSADRRDGRRTEPRRRAPLISRSEGEASPWTTGLADRIDAGLESDEWSKETPVVAPGEAELRTLFGHPDPTRQQPIAEIEQLQRRAAELADEPPRRSPHPTAEVDPDDIEAAIEVAPPARRLSHTKPAGKPKKTK